MGIYLKDIIEGTCRKSVQDENGKNISDTYLKKTGDAKDNTVTFQTDDNVETTMQSDPANPGGTLVGYKTETGDNKWHIMHPLDIKDRLSATFNKFTTLFHNVRYLYELCGKNDISKLGDGTLTGAISKLNTDINAVSAYAIPQPQTDNVFTGFKYWYARIYKIGRVVTMTVSLQGAMESSGFHKLFTIPETYHPIEQVIGSYPTMAGNNMSLRIIQTGEFELGNSGTKIPLDWICRVTVTYISQK